MTFTFNVLLLLLNAERSTSQQLTIRKQFAEYTWSGHQHIDNILWHIS